MRVRWNPTLLASVAASALLGWVFVPWLWPAETRLARPTAVRPAAWRLPDLPRKPDLAGAGLATVTSPIFEPEAPVGAAAAPPEDPRWRIAGIFGSGRERMALIEFRAPGKQPLRLGAGARLPSGELIKRIDGNELVLQSDNRSLRMGVEYRE